MRARSICRTEPRVRPVAARNRRSMVRPEPAGRWPRQDLGDERVAHKGTGSDETVGQGLGVVGAGRVPAVAVQPEGAGA